MIIYKITNKINNKVYIGQTIKTLEERWKQHLSAANNNDHKHLYQSINKYGKDNFIIEIIDQAKDIDDLNQKEKYWVDYYNSLDPNIGYNNIEGGITNPMNYETIKEFHNKRMRSEEVKTKISNTMKKLRKEKGFSEETRNKISQKLKGNQHFKGKKRTPEAIQKTSESLFKSVYCIDLEGNVLQEFNSVKEAAKWWNDNGYKRNKLESLSNKIKESAVNNKYIKDIKWIYKLNCVETIERVDEDRVTE